MDGVANRAGVLKFEAFLAGLQAGMLGALWMLAWMGLISAWQRRSFWLPENLMGSVFHPHGEIIADFGGPTVSGLALYLLLYSLLGAGFAVAASRGSMRPARTRLLALAFAVAWYYGSFHLLWKPVAPVITLLNPARPAIIGHVIFGIVLGRFPKHLPHDERPVTEIVAEPAKTDSLAPNT